MERDALQNDKLHEIQPEISNRVLRHFKTRINQVIFTRCGVKHMINHVFFSKVKTLLNVGLADSKTHLTV